MISASKSMPTLTKFGKRLFLTTLIVAAFNSVIVMYYAFLWNPGDLSSSVIPYEFDPASIFDMIIGVFMIGFMVAIKYIFFYSFAEAITKWTPPAHAITQRFWTIAGLIITAVIDAYALVQGYVPLPDAGFAIIIVFFSSFFLFIALVIMLLVLLFTKLFGK